MEKTAQIISKIIFFITVVVVFFWVIHLSKFAPIVLGTGTSASDAFSRTTSNGWGTADIGGNWTIITGTASDFSTDGSVALTNILSAATNHTILLNSVSAQDIVSAFRFKTDKVASGGPIRVYFIGRHISNGNEYHGRININTSGTVQLQGTAFVGSSETLLGSPSTVSGITYAANTYYWVKISISGTSPTTVQMKFWADGTTEPASYSFSATDSSSVLQTSGSAGVESALTSNVNNFPVVFTYDDFAVTNSDPAVTPTPTPVPTPTPSPSPTPIVYSSATDTFARTVSSGWGTADTGGDYTLSGGSAVNYSVTSGQGTINETGPAIGQYAMLNSVSIQNADVKFKVKVDALPVGTNSDAGASIIVRRNGNDEYRGRLRFTAAGTTTLVGTKLVSNVETTIGTAVTVSSLIPAPNTYVWIRGQIDGTNPTTIRLKAWVDGDSEPGSYQYTATDSEGTLQVSGPVGVRISLPAAVTNAPILFTVASFSASSIVPTPTPTNPPLYNLTGTVYTDSNGNGVQDGTETGYQGLTMTLSGAGSASTTTDSSGNYSFSSLPAGTYTETLSLPSGYLPTTTNPVSVPLSADTATNFGIQSAVTATAALDTFTRTVTSGWGSADTGGPYTLLGSTADFNTDGSIGTMTMNATGSANQRTARLDGAKGQNMDYTMRVQFDKLPDIINGNFIFLVARHVSSGNEYRGWIRFDNTGGVYLRASRIVTSAETVLAAEQKVLGLTYSAGGWLDIHFQLVGASPTTLNMRAWADGTSEPSTWTYSTTDSTAILQQSGSIGILTRLGSVTNTPVVSKFDDLQMTTSTISTPTPSPSPTPSPVPATTYSFPTNITKVFTILLENEDWSNVKGSASAPYINSLITGLNSNNSFNTTHSDVVYASNYKSVLPGETGAGYLHPSEPNYIWLEAGTNAFSDTTFTSDNSPSTQSTTSVDHIATLLNTAGKVWRAYQENKPSGCPIGNGTLFIPRHSPFVYFQDVSSTAASGGVGTPSNSSTYCQAHEFDYTQLATDLAAGGSSVADYNFITPNTCDDGHDSTGCTTADKVKNADTWLSNNLPTILNSSTYQAGHAVVFILTDEDSGSTTNNPIGMLAISPKTKGNGYASTVAFSHSSYVKTIEEIFGLTPLLGHAADVGTSDLGDLFGDPVIAAAGDIACGAGSTSATCQQQATADLIGTINPSVVLPLGDDQYESGALSDFQSFYDPSWGTYKRITQPSVGNHEYITTGASGYFDYFNGVGNQLGQGGDRSKGYYSYNVGNWHLIALNSDCSQAGGCGPGSGQDTFLKADLAANPNKCLLAYDHHPMFSSGQQPHNSGVDNLYQDLYNARADVYLVAHDHDYERFYPSDPHGNVDPTNGITEFVAGEGGRNHTQLSSSGLLSNSAVFDATTFGVLKMTLHNASFDYQFVPSASTITFTNGTFTESGSGNCHWLTATATPSPSPSPTPVTTYTLSGTVYNDLDQNGFLDTGENGLSGVTVKLTGNSTTSTTTAANGSYSFANVGAGSYTVTVQLPTGYKSTTQNPTTISLTNDTQANFGLAAFTNSFQPTPPFYATFFYNWFKNPTTDGANQWGIWSDPDTNGTHNPPTNWFSNYLPQPTLNTFAPSTDLYSSNDYNIFKWQLTQLAHAKQEVAIASWWGQADRSDVAFSHQITDFMNRSDNPYPNLRWATYYECEGNTCNGTQNPTVSQLVSDLNYIESNYANQPTYLKVGNKPVIFVYGDPTDAGTADSTCSDNSMSARWYQAARQATTPFYVVLKVFSGYASDPCQPDSWHQYAPSSRTDSQGTYSYMVSPGFWRIGAAPRLPRDLSSFASAVQSMVASNATWRITETWNEWGEGSAVEPGTEVIQANSNTAATQNSNGTTFQNAYVDTLNIYLPSLPNGIGVGGSATPSPAPTYTLSGTVYNDTNGNGVQDAGESGIVGATVALSGISNATATTNTGGVYTFSNLNQGSYTVTLTLPSGYVSTTANSIDIPVTTDTSVNFGISSSITPSPAPSGAVVLSGVSVTPTDTGGFITWSTNKLADSEMLYGASSLYGDSITADVDGTTTHSLTISVAQPCTTIYYRLTSLDDVGDTGSAPDSSFVTSGCNGNAGVISDISTLISQATGGEISDLDSGLHGIKISVPALFGSTSAVFQIHQLAAGPAINNSSFPSGYNTVSTYVYDAKALTDVSTLQTTFNSPLTVTIYYADTDVSGNDPTTLKMMQYHGGSWSLMTGCTQDTTLRQISCPTSTFSVFALVNGQSVATSSSSSSSGSSVCTSTIPTGVPLIYQINTTATTAVIYFAPAIPQTVSYTLSYGPNLHTDYYSYIFNTGLSGGALSLKVNLLKLYTYYTFRLRANNGCAAGKWSNVFTASTGFWPFYTNRYYLWQQKNLYNIIRFRK